jgi:hypothetical protein
MKTKIISQRLLNFFIVVVVVVVVVVARLFKRKLEFVLAER